MANDCITRQSAIRIICDDECEDCPDGGCDMYRRLKRLPAADVLSEMWTPVTKRLPESNGWYLVYAPTYCGGSSTGQKIINGVMFSKYNGRHWSIEVGYHKRPGCVVAWMPIPDPPMGVIL